MTLVPSNTRFIGFSQLANLDERKSEFLNSISQPFSMQDIAASSGNFETTDPYYNNPAIKVEIETSTHVWLGNYDGVSTTPFLEIDLNDCSSFVMEFASFSFAGYTQAGTYAFAYNAQAVFGQGSMNAPAAGIENWTYVEISYIITDNIASFYMTNTIGEPSTAAIEVLYTLKKFKLPMRFD
jgi:hypothetical protein